MKMYKRYYPIILFFLLLFFVGCSTAVPTLENQPPTITSTPPSGGLFLGESYSYDVESTDPDGDPLTYNFISNPAGMTLINSTGVINWIPTVLGNYNVIIEVSDGELSDTQSFTLTVSVPITIITPSAPTNVDASDTLVGKVHITWDTVIGATHYKVYRDEDFFGSTRIPIYCRKDVVTG